MAEFGELALVVGDFHIPHRAATIPEKFQKILVPNKMKHVLCTGNFISKQQLDYFGTLAPNVHVVRGDFDDDPTIPEHKIINIGDFKIGLIHGHQIVPWGDEKSLAMMQRQLDVDILISGHTHKKDVKQKEDKWFINPGSITGAYSSINTDVLPSFILLGIHRSKVIIYVYELQDGEVSVQKSEFAKA
jgi:vacuolar protein sorting-associated protein 29